MARVTRILPAFFLPALIAAAQSPEVAHIERSGEVSTLSVHTFRPMDAVATLLESHFGIPVGSEDPVFSFRGDMADISAEVAKVRRGALVPAQWGFEVQFPVKQDGSLKDIRDLLRTVVAAANAKSQFGYRLDEADGAFSFVPTRTHDAQGRSIAMTPPLDRPVTIPPGTRRVFESAGLMARKLSRQTGLVVSCCQSILAGYPWGMEETEFSATDEPARSVLRRLGLTHWHMRCDQRACMIDMR